MGKFCASSRIFASKILVCEMKSKLSDKAIARSKKIVKEQIEGKADKI